jgi:hypothetical protein
LRILALKEPSLNSGQRGTTTFTGPDGKEQEWLVMKKRPSLCSTGDIPRGIPRDSAHMFSNLHEAFVWLFLELIVPLLLIIKSLVLLNHQQGARPILVAVLLLLEGCWYTNLAAEY